VLQLYYLVLFSQHRYPPLNLHFEEEKYFLIKFIKIRLRSRQGAWKRSLYSRIETDCMFLLEKKY